MDGEKIERGDERGNKRTYIRKGRNMKGTWMDEGLQKTPHGKGGV
jgi:hypothetical protein